MRAWRGLPGFRGDSAFGTWLHRITVRLALDRAATLRTRGTRELAVTPELLESVETAASDTTIPSEARRLIELMADVSDVQRAALTLYYLEDRSVEEVARVLQMPLNTVKTHLSRGRAALRRAWTESATREGVS